MAGRRRKHHLARDEKFIVDVLVGITMFFVLVRYLPSGWLISLEWITGNQVARLGVALFAVVLAAIDFKRKRPIAAGIALVPAIVVLIEVILFIPFHKVEKPLSVQQRVRVLTFNSATKELPGVVDAMVADSVDIACMQEVYVAHLTPLLDSAKAHGYEGHFILLRDDAGMGTVVFSREPILSVDTLATSSWNEKVRRFTRVVTTVRGRQVKVVSLQLESMVRNKDLWGIIASWKLRLEQAQRVRDAMIGGTMPIIVAGDLNSTVTNRAVRDLLNSFHDSWRVAGFGLGGTWFRSLPLFRIDYILYNGFDGAANPRFKRLGRSDHLAYRIDLLPEADKVE